MKRLISLICLCLSLLWVQAQQSEFDPANPGDPMPYYILTVEVSPSSGGSTNISRTLVAEGQEIALHVSANAHFRFQQWVCGDEVLSADSYLYYTMPARNVTVTAQMLYVEPGQEEFNPESPGDPAGQGEVAKRHLVTIYTSPSIGGRVNNSMFYMAEGDRQELYAYSNSGYEFIGWYIDDKLESPNNPVMVTMREQDITLTARFRFSPTSPEDPGANMYDAATGTLVIDRFTPSRLSDVVNLLVGDGDYGNVVSLTVLGEMSSSDYGVVRMFSNIESVDLSRTTGYTAVPSWAFENMSTLQRLSLPSTVVAIGDYAFYGCSALKELVLYAEAPPRTEQTVSELFNGVASNLVVRVPSNSEALYQASSPWNLFVILSMDKQSLTVTIPENKVALYENMFLELLDTKSEQLRRYVITPRNMYVFADVFKQTTYQLTLRNALGKVFGQEMINFTSTDTMVAFSHLLRPVDIRMQVVDAEGADITSHTTIKWYDKDNGYLCKGALLASQVEGEVVSCQITLDETIGVLYQQPDSSVWVIAEVDKNNLRCTLHPFTQVALSGKVVDGLSSKPVRNAEISFTQVLNNKYVRTLSTQTDNDGLFNMTIFDVPADIVLRASNYNKYTGHRTDETDIGIIKLETFSGSVIAFAFTYQPVRESPAEEATRQIGYADGSNIVYDVYNWTTGKTIEDFETKYPQLMLDEILSPEDSLVITLSSRNNDFAATVVGGRVNPSSGMSLNADLIEKGQIKSIYNYSEAETVVALLYDSEGNIKNKATYLSQAVQFSHLDAGSYTLISMEQNNRYNGMTTLSDFDKIGLTAGTDYVLSEFVVADGLVSGIQLDTIPGLSEELMSFMNEGTGFTVSKPSVTSGDYLTLRAKLSYKQSFVNSIDNVKLIVDIPTNVAVVENAVLVGNKLSSYEITDRHIVIPLSTSDEVVRFCVIPNKEGRYPTSAYLQFTYNNQETLQPIGNTEFVVNDLDIQVPPTIAGKKLNVSGMAFTYASIEVYDGTTLVGKTKANATGYWAAVCELANAYNYSTHNIRAKAIKNDGTEFWSKTEQCTCDASLIEISKVKMYHWNAETRTNYEVIFDFLNPQNKPASYIYHIYNRIFEFYIDFTSNDTTIISDVELKVFTGTNQTYILRCVFDDKKQCWKTQGEFGNFDNNVPVNVAVRYKIESTVRGDRQELDAQYEAVRSSEDYVLSLKDSIQTIIRESISDSIDNAIRMAKMEQLLASITAADESTNTESLVYEFLSVAGYADESPAKFSKKDDADIEELLAYGDALLDRAENDSIESLLSEWEQSMLAPDSLMPDSTDMMDMLSKAPDTLTYEEDGLEKHLYSIPYSSFDLATIDTAQFEHLEMTSGSDVLSYSDGVELTIIDQTGGIVWVVRVDAKDTARAAQVRARIKTADNNFVTFVQSVIDRISFVLNAVLAWKDKVLSPVEQEIKVLEQGMKDLGERELELAASSAACAITAKDYEQQIAQLKSHINTSGTTQAEIGRMRKQISELTHQRNIKLEQIKRFDKLRGECGAKLAGYKSRKLIKAAFVNEILGYVDLINKTRELIQYGYAMIKNTNNWNAFIKSITPCENDQKKADAIVSLSKSNQKEIQGKFKKAFGISAVVNGINYFMTFNPAGLKRLTSFLTGLITDFINDIAARNYQQGQEMSSTYMKLRMDDRKKLKCYKGQDDDEDKDGDWHHSGNTNSTTLIDPSGYVYEAVSENRIEGVQATIFYKDKRENVFGETVEEDVIWDAENYNQENPLYTDADGMYHWDVPQGLWQVRFEKDGYESTQSEWLPVPPPQLEVNIPIVQLRQPEVINAIAHKNAIDIKFDKFMQPELLNTDNIFVTANRQKVEGAITLLDEQPSFGASSIAYASQLRFVPAADFAAREITLTVSNRVRSYADVPMAQTFQQTFDVEGAGLIEQVDAPVASLPTGQPIVYGTELALSCATPGATIRYTTDGSMPDCLHGYIYTQPIVLYSMGNSITVSAIACADGYEPSELRQWIYSFDEMTAVTDILSSSQMPTKLLRDGQLYIRMSDGRIFNAIGERME